MDKFGSEQRESNIELLKLVAIIFVILSHSMPDGDTTILAFQVQ